MTHNSLVRASLDIDGLFPSRLFYFVLQIFDLGRSHRRVNFRRDSQFRPNIHLAHLFLQSYLLVLTELRRRLTRLSEILFGGAKFVFWTARDDHLNLPRGFLTNGYGPWCRA